MIFNVTGGGGGSGATLVITGVAGDTCTISKSGKSKSKTFGSDGKATFKGLETGTWTVTMTNSSGSTATTTVNITADYTTSIDYSAIPEYTYSGSSQFVLEDDNENWHLKLLTSGNLNFSKLGNAKNIEVFLVGGGGAGANGGGSGGGGGGYITTAEIQPEEGVEYEVIVGAGAPAGSNGTQGGTTSMMGQSAQGGHSSLTANQANGWVTAGGAGGSGGGSGGWHGTRAGNGGTNGGNGGSGSKSGGSGGGVSTIPWGDEEKYGRYSGGGGGGNSGGGSGDYSAGIGGYGGGGNGDGVTYGVYEGTAGADNTGGGGGGSGATQGKDGRGFAGGSGIALMRNKRS